MCMSQHFLGVMVYQINSIFGGVNKLYPWVTQLSNGYQHLFSSGKMEDTFEDTCAWFAIQVGTDSDVANTDGIAISVCGFNSPRGFEFPIWGKVVLGVTYMVWGCRVEIEVSLSRIWCVLRYESFGMGDIHCWWGRWWSVVLGNLCWPYFLPLALQVSLWWCRQENGPIRDPPK